MDGLRDTDISLLETIPAGAAVTAAMITVCVLGSFAHSTAISIAALFAAG